MHHRHSINEIASQLSPAPQCTGIELLQADTFDVHCFQTLTGTKFVIVSERHTPDVDEMLRTTYDGGVLQLLLVVQGTYTD